MIGYAATPLCECGFALLVELDFGVSKQTMSTAMLRCVNKDCEHHGKLFEWPRVELKPIDPQQFFGNS
jgi:hypothetical protein